MEGYEGSHSVAPQLSVPPSLHRFAAGSESGGVIHLFPRLSCRPCGHAVGGAHGALMCRSSSSRCEHSAPAVFPRRGSDCDRSILLERWTGRLFASRRGPSHSSSGPPPRFPCPSAGPLPFKGCDAVAESVSCRSPFFPGMSYPPRHTCMAIRWHKNAIGTSPGLEPGSRRQSPRSRGNHRGPWGPPHTTREGTNPLFSGNGGRSPFVPGTRTPFGSHLSEKGVRQKFPRSRKKGGTARKWVWFRERPNPLRPRNARSPFAFPLSFRVYFDPGSVPPSGSHFRSWFRWGEKGVFAPSLAPRGRKFSPRGATLGAGEVASPSRPAT